MAQSDLGHSSFNRWISLGEGDPDSGAGWNAPIAGIHGTLHMKTDWGFFCRNKSKAEADLDRPEDTTFADSWKTAALPFRIFPSPWEYWSILVLMGMDRPLQPGVLGLRTCSRRWFCILSLLSPSWLTLVLLCNIVSSSEFQIALLTRREMAVYVAWSLRLLLQKVYWTSKRPRLVGRQCFVLFNFSLIYTKNKAISKTQMENICNIYFLFVNSSDIYWVLFSLLMINLWELNLLWAMRQNDKDNRRYNLKKSPLLVILGEIL